jgi:hypothetical protein
VSWPHELKFAIPKNEKDGRKRMTGLRGGKRGANEGWTNGGVVNRKILHFNTKYTFQILGDELLQLIP